VRRLARELGVPLEQLTGGGSLTRITADDVVARAMQRQTASTGGSFRSTPATRGERDAGWKSPVASPRARRVAQELGVDWTALIGSGRDGRVREEDVRAAAANATQASSIRIHAPQSGRAERIAVAIPLSQRRRSIAANLRRSQELTVPVTLTTTADATHFVALREQFKAQAGEIVPAYTDIAACLAGRVLLRHPGMCVRWTPEHDALLPVGQEAIDIGIAVDTSGGLIVPVARDAGRSSLLAFAEASRGLIDRAREGRLTGDEMQGAVLTITSLGAYGIEAFTPVINDPEIAILGLGAIRREAVVLPDDRIVPQDRITLSLTFDHAAIDGAPAAAFLRDVAAAIAAPAVLLLGT